MEQELFETRAISIFHDREYVFYDELQQGASIKRMNTAHYAGLVAVGALAGLGAFRINQSSATDSEVKSELVKLGALCDLIGIKLTTAAVNLVLFVYSDELTDEAIVGKCYLIKDRLSFFKKFSMRIGWNKMPVSATTFFVFRNSTKAFHFRQSVQDHCKHFPLFNQLWVLPWGIDLAAKSAWSHKGLPVNWIKPSEIEAKLFS